jgi:hypothetical protein
LLYHLHGVPLALRRILQLGQQRHDVEPGQLVSGPLTEAALLAVLKKRMYFKLLLDQPRMSRNESWRSRAKRSITLAPQPCVCCRYKLSRPMRPSAPTRH